MSQNDEPASSTFHRETSGEQPSHPTGRPSRPSAAAQEPPVVIVIPADDDEPITIEQVPPPPARTQAYQNWVDGLFQAIDLDDPAGSLYCNDEGKIRSMPVNVRATILGRVHNPGLAGDIICGPAFVAGAPDDEGDETTAPSELVHLFANHGLAQTQFADPHVPDRWIAHAELREWKQAYLWAAHITGPLLTRVVPTADTETLLRWQSLGEYTHGEHRRAHGQPIRTLACRSIEDLAQQIRHTDRDRCSMFSLRDMALVSRTLDSHDGWLMERDGYVHAVPPLRPLIEEGTFADLITRLLSATHAQRRKGQY